MENGDPHLPLSDVVVADFSTRLPGPLTTLVLAQLGARIWKLEPPGGDVARHHPVFSFLNSGKMSVELDLKRPDGLGAAQALVDRADVLVEGFKPGVLDKLGLGYEAACARNPRLVYCSLTGFGSSGPRSNHAGHDITYLALAGVLAHHRDQDGAILPGSLPVPAADMTSGLLAAIGILGALEQRRRTGRGTRVDVDLLSSSLLLGAAGMAGGHAEAPVEPAHYGVFTTADARGLALGITVHEDHFWRSFCRAAEVEEWVDVKAAERTERRDELHAVLKELIGSRTLQEWTRRLPGDSIPWAPVLEPEEVARDPHHGGLPLPGEPGAPVPLGIEGPPLTAAPSLDQHRDVFAREILGDLTSR